MVNIDEIKAGDTVVLDGGFTCREAGPVVLEEDDKGELFFQCRQGQHFVDGQADEDGFLVGISKE